MPRSLGTFTAASSSVNPAVEGTTIDEVDFNALIDDIESGLTESTYTAGLGSTDNRVARTDGTDTKKLQGSAVSIDDSGNMSGVAALSATTIELGHATDTTIARSGAGDITIEGNAVYRAGGTDVPVTDGGTGASTAAAGFRALAEGVGSTQGDVLFRDGTQWTVLGAGSAGQVLTSGGAGADVSWSAAGSGDVTAGAVMTDNTIVRGDGGSKGVQDSGVTIDDTDNVAGMATLTLPNTGLHLLDTNASHDLIIAPGSDLSSDRTLTVTTSDADRTLDLTAGSMAPTTAGLAMVEAADVAAQTALLNAVVGDSGSGGTKGLVPAPAAGDAAAAKFLAADGTWTTPAGAGDVAASSTFGTDNVVIRSDGTSKNVQSSGVSIDDSNNVSGVVNQSMTGYLDVTEIATPGNPSANVARLYAYDDGGTTKIAYRDSAGAETVISSAAGGQPAPPQYRLTLTTGTPVLTSTVSAAGTLYWTPYGGNVAWVYDGSSEWVAVTPGELSIALSGATASRLSDVFLDYNGGTPQLVLTAWTNDTTRATALTKQDGRYVLTGATDHLYLGTIYVDGSNQCNFIFGAGSSGGTAGQLDVWNYYNRVEVASTVHDTTVSWTYSTATWRQANNSSGWQNTFVVGVCEDAVESWYRIASTSTAANSYNGLGLDSTTAQMTGASVGSMNGSSILNMIAGFQGFVAAGRHYIAALERNNSTSGTNTWHSNTGGDSSLKSALSLRFKM